MQSWILPAITAFTFWGVWALFPKITVRYIDPRSALFFQALGAFLVALIVLASMKFRPALDVRGVSLALLTGAVGISGGLAYLFAVSRGPATLISASTALYPILTVILAQVFLHEPVTLKQWVGIALAMVAIVLVGG